MLNNIIKYFILYIFLVLLQVLILDNISLQGYGVSFLYIYFIIKLPIATNRYLSLFLGFILGLTLDLFSNTPGMNAAATTLVAFISSSVQNLFFQRDDYETYTPGLSLLGGNFMKYVIVCVFIHTSVLFLIESASYFNLAILILKVLSSTLVTSLLIFAIEGFSLSKKKRE